MFSEDGRVRVGMHLPDSNGQPVRLSCRFYDTITYQRFLVKTGISCHTVPYIAKLYSITIERVTFNADNVDVGGRCVRMIDRWTISSLSGSRQSHVTTTQSDITDWQWSIQQVEQWTGSSLVTPQRSAANTLPHVRRHLAAAAVAAVAIVTQVRSLRIQSRNSEPC